MMAMKMKLLSVDYRRGNFARALKDIADAVEKTGQYWENGQ